MYNHKIMPDLSIIFPVHNEAVGIASFLRQVTKVMRNLKGTYEIICVENGSTDDSLKILKKLATRDKHLNVIVSPQGWGNAVRAGINHSGGKLTLYMVSDNQVDPKYIPVLYDEYIRQASRTGSPAMVKVRRTSRENNTRLVSSRIFNFFSTVLFGVGSRDINATPKIIETKLLRDMRLTSENIAFDLELLLKLKNRGLSWIEIPVPSKRRDSGKSTTNFKAVWEMISNIVRFRLGYLK